MKFIKKQGGNITFGFIVIALAVMPLLLSAGVLSGSSTILFLGKCMAFAVVAMGLDLIWGYTGILSLGHGLYFALGGYAMAMYLKLQETHGGITDFMHVGGLEELPLIWRPFKSLPLTLILIVVVPALVAGIIGYFIFKNRVIIKLPSYERVRRGIGYVPQGRDIFPQMTVKENLELGLQPIGGKGKIPDYLYELFPILPKFEKRRGGDLSGGQQQQLAIARALVAEPKLLILDEPTEGIQPSIIKDIGASIQKINSWKKITVLLVEQYLDFVMENSVYVNVMEKGEIVYSGETAKSDKAEIQRLMTE